MRIYNWLFKVFIGKPKVTAGPNHWCTANINKSFVPGPPKAEAPKFSPGTYTVSLDGVEIGTCGTPEIIFDKNMEHVSPEGWIDYTMSSDYRIPGSLLTSHKTGNA